MTRRLVRRVFGVCAVLVAGVALVTAPGSTAGAGQATDPTKKMCYQPWLQDTGWGTQVCDGDITGAMDPNVRVEAWSLSQSGAGRVCFTAHLVGLGWQNERCGVDSTLFQIGAIGWGMDIDGLQWHTDNGMLCINALYRFADGTMGWSGTGCARTADVTTTGPPGSRIQGIVAWFD